MQQGEVWLVNFQPQVNTEITKTRPAVIVSDIALSGLTTRIVVPFRDTKPHHGTILYYVVISPTKANGLIKTSSADCSQVKSFDTARFVKKLGIILPTDLHAIRNGVCLCIGI